MMTNNCTAATQRANAQNKAIDGPWPTIQSSKARGKEGARPPGAIASDTAMEGVTRLKCDTPPKQQCPSYLAVANGTAPKTLATNPKTVLDKAKPNGDNPTAQPPAATMMSLGTGNMRPGGNKAAAGGTKPLPSCAGDALGSANEDKYSADAKTADGEPEGGAKGKEGATTKAAGSCKAAPGKKTVEKAGKKGGKKPVGTGKGAKDDGEGPAKKDGGAKSTSDKKEEAQKPANKTTSLAASGAGSAAKSKDAAPASKNAAEEAPANSTCAAQDEPAAPAFSLKCGSAGACRFAGARRVAAGKPRPDKGAAGRCEHKAGRGKGGVKACKQAVPASKAAEATAPLTNGAPIVEAAAEDEGMAVKGTLDEVDTASAARDHVTNNTGPADTAGESATIDAATEPATVAATDAATDNDCCKGAAAAAPEGEVDAIDDTGSGDAAAEEEVTAPCCGAAATDGPSCDAVDGAGGCADTAATASYGHGSTCPGITKDPDCARASSCGGGDGPGTPDSTTDARRLGPFRWGSGASRLSSASSSFGRRSSTGSGAGAAACDDEGASGPLGAGGRLSSCAGQLPWAEAAADLPADDAAAAQRTEANFGSRIISAALRSAAAAVAEDEEQEQEQQEREEQEGEDPGEEQPGVEQQEEQQGEEQEQEQQEEEEQQRAVTAPAAAEPPAADVSRRRHGSRLRSLVCWGGVAAVAVCCGVAFGLARARRR